MTSYLKSVQNGKKIIMQAIETENHNALIVFLHPESRVPRDSQSVYVFSHGGCNPCGHK